jgi:hypothetical protein
MVRGMGEMRDRSETQALAWNNVDPGVKVKSD